MSLFFAVLLAIIFALLSALHVYWALGGKWALQAAIPTQPEHQHRAFEPPVIATWLVALALFLAAILSLMRVGLVLSPLSTEAIRVAVWGMAAVFFLRAVGDFRYCGLFKRIHGTLFSKMDSMIYIPLCLSIALFAALIAL